jgi:hypothetical protein
MIVVLLVAIFTVHLPNGFSSIKLMSYDAASSHFGQPALRRQRGAPFCGRLFEGSPGRLIG